MTPDYMQLLQALMAGGGGGMQDYNSLAAGMASSPTAATNGAAMGGAALPAAGTLEQLGDPNAASAPLYQDAKQWSPVQTESDALLGANPQAQHRLGQGGSPFGFNAMINPPAQRPMPQATVDAFGNVPPPDISGNAVPPAMAGLTAAQSKELLGLMPDGRGFNPPDAVAGRVTPFNGQMAQLQAGPSGQQRRLTLGDLIYGAR